MKEREFYKTASVKQLQTPRESVLQIQTLYN